MAESSQQRLKKNMLALAVVQLSNYILPLLILPYLTRTLGVEGFALVSVALAAIQISFVITDYGLSVYAPYQISLIKSSPEKVNRFISNIYGLKACLLLVAICIVTPIMWSQHAVDWSGLLIFSLLAIFFQAYQPVWLFHGIEKMNGVAITSVVTKLSYVALVLVFVDDGSGTLTVIASWAAAQAVAAVASNWLLFKHGYRFSRPVFHEVLDIGRACRGYFVSRLAVEIFSSVNTLVLSAVGDRSQVALYAVCDQLYKAGKNATMPVTQALYPYMTNNKNWGLFYKILFTLTAALACGAFTTMLISNHLIGIVFGEIYEAASSTLDVFLFAVVVNFVSVLFGYPAFGALGRPDLANKTVIIGACYHIVALTFCIAVFRLDSLMTAYVTLSTECIIMTMRVFKLNQLKHHPTKPV